MTFSDDGGSAFPLAAHAYPHECAHDDIEPTHLGMTLRDYFAGQALTGAFADGGNTEVLDDVMARRYYEIADAMLAARLK